MDMVMASVVVPKIMTRSAVIEVAVMTAVMTAVVTSFTSAAHYTCELVSKMRKPSNLFSKEKRLPVLQQIISHKLGSGIETKTYS